MSAIISRDIANSAANIAASKLYREFSWSAGFDSTDLSGGDYKVVLKDVNFDTTFTLKRVKLMAIANFAGRSDTVVVVMAQPPFSNYASFNSQWPTNLYYGTGYTLWGPVHTNQKFGFAGYPVFYGKVTSVAPNYKTLGATNPLFLGGHQSGGVWVVTNGYQEKPIYDGRFLNIGPPVFPIVQKVSPYSWQEDAGIEDYNHDMLMLAPVQSCPCVRLAGRRIHELCDETEKTTRTFRHVTKVALL